MAMRNTLSVTDNRTGQTYEIPIEDGAVRATELRQIRTDEEDFGLKSYDPGFLNTAPCGSQITFVDGERGILEHRGYPIDQLTEHCSFLEVACLLIRGELPDRAELDEWVHQIKVHTLIHENIKKLIDAFRYDAHPMGMLTSTVAALSTFYPDAKNIQDAHVRELQIYRLLGKMPTLAAFAYRHALGFPYIYPDNELGYTGNLLAMMFRMTEKKWKPVPALEQALDKIFILHADHEQNCSANAMRCVGSSHVDPFSATAAACAALYGPLHGGANEAALQMLREIGSKAGIPQFIKRVQAGESRLMGFGHRVYKSYDPRVKVIKGLADAVFEVTGRNELIDIALELERIALDDDYFISRRLYPNIDFYSGLIYQSMGFPVSMFPVLFAIPRTAGWLAQWQESLLDPEQKIARPRQIYRGKRGRDVIPIDKRQAPSAG